ncbi:MAG: hypothetical protein LBC18_13775, partial [Opitutaceae bacterium]|nr:hypothetical protein [Opitutaceae bacterium]
MILRFFPTAFALDEIKEFFVGGFYEIIPVRPVACLVPVMRVPVLPVVRFLSCGFACCFFGRRDGCRIGWRRLPVIDGPECPPFCFSWHSGHRRFFAVRFPRGGKQFQQLRKTDASRCVDYIKRPPLDNLDVIFPCFVRAFYGLQGQIPFYFH